MAWYDFNNTGGFDLGDISAGLSKGISSIGGLFGDSTPQDTSMDAFKKMELGAYNNSPLSYGIPTTSSGGLFDKIDSGLDWMGENKDTLGVLGTIGKGIFDYKSASDMRDLAQQELNMKNNYYNTLIAEQQRQVQKEEDSTANMQAGFESSGLFNPNKKKTTSNYYSV